MKEILEKMSTSYGSQKNECVSESDGGTTIKRAVVEEEVACTPKLALLLPGGLAACPDSKKVGGLTLNNAGKEEEGMGEKCKTPKRKFRDEDESDQGSTQGTNFNFNLSDSNQVAGIFTPKRMKTKQDN